MKMRIFKFLLILLLSKAIAAQEGKWYNSSSNTLQYELNGIIKRIVFVDHSIVNVSARKSSHLQSFKSLIVENISNKYVPFKLTESVNDLIVETKTLKLFIHKKTGAITFNDGKTLLYVKEADYSEKSFESIVDIDKKAYTVQQGFKLTEDEGIYGLGEFQDGKINRRGKKIVMVQSNQQDVIPFIVSTNNYGILWDNYSKTIFNDTKKELSFWSEIADEINYYFIAGKNMDSVIAGYRNITGKAPMFGKSVFGYWQSRERYTSADQLLNIASKYRKRRIPIDYIVQDWNYWGGNQYWSGMQ